MVELAVPLSALIQVVKVNRGGLSLDRKPQMKGHFEGGLATPYTPTCTPRVFLVILAPRPRKVYRPSCCAIMPRDKVLTGRASQCQMQLSEVIRNCDVYLAGCQRIGYQQRERIVVVGTSGETRAKTTCGCRLEEIRRSAISNLLHPHQTGSFSPPAIQ